MSTERERAYAEACKRATSIERAGGGPMVLVSVDDADGFYRVQSIDVPLRVAETYVALVDRRRGRTTALVAYRAATEQTEGT